MKTTSQRLASLISQYEKGAIIQKREQNKTWAEWQDTTFPEWNIAIFDYRVKPKQKKRKQVSGYILKNEEGSIVLDKKLRVLFHFPGAYSCEVIVKKVDDLKNKRNT